MKRMLYLLIVLVIVVGWRDWAQGDIDHPPGVLVPEEPRQLDAGNAQPFGFEGYRLNPRARFEIRARVLSRADYRWSKGADLSPMDLALGWRRMSDQSVLDRIDVSQGARWYYTRYEHPSPLPDRDIIHQSGNMHMVPGNDLVHKRLRGIRPGHIIQASGYLVDAEHRSGFSWRTSLSREDSGDGACELFYVERLDVENG
jgi:hypothetical protein